MCVNKNIMAETFSLLVRDFKTTKLAAEANKNRINPSGREERIPRATEA